MLKDYYYEDCLILDEEWEELYDLDVKVRDFDEVVDILNKCNTHPFPITRDNAFFKNLPATDDELDKRMQQESRFIIIKTAVIFGWMEKEFMSEKLSLNSIYMYKFEDFETTFNTVLNNIHHKGIKKAFIAKNYPFETRKDVYYTYPVPQILIDELNNHKKFKEK